MVSAQAYAAVMKYTHTVNGLFLWEFFTTLDYEWKVFRGRLPYRWTIWLYSVSRVTGLISLVILFVCMDATTVINHNCQLWVRVSNVFLSLATSSATLLLVLRIIAIWNRNKIAVALVILLWGVNIGCRIQAVSMIRVVLDSVHLACELIKTENSEIGYIPVLISNMVLLLIMFVGLLVLRRDDGNSTSGLTYFLWKQGVLWFALAIATEVPPLVLFALNFSYQFNLVFLAPCAVTMIIAATRMHRSLVKFASAPPDREKLNIPVSSINFSETVRTGTAPTTLHRVELAVNTTFEQHPMAQISKDDSSNITTKSAHSIPPSPIQFTQSV